MCQNPKQLQTYTEMESTEDSTETCGEDNGEEEEMVENESETKKFPDTSEADSGISESESEEPPVKKAARCLHVFYHRYNKDTIKKYPSYISSV